MTGFKPFADDWPFHKDTPTKTTGGTEDRREPPRDWDEKLRRDAIAKQAAEDVDRLPWPPKPAWIATNGRNLSGHDFGCEWIWVVWYGRTQLITAKVARGPAMEWEHISHYMPTDIRTPEPPA